MKPGYARFSTSEQVRGRQLDGLRPAGGEQVLLNLRSGQQTRWQTAPNLRPLPAAYSAWQELHGASQQSTRQLTAYLLIGSQRRLYKILRLAGCAIAFCRAAGLAHLILARG